MEKTLGYVFGTGALYGASAAGRSVILGRNRKEIEKSFSKVKVFASSVGVYSGAYLLSNQFETAVEFWPNKVGGRQLINPTMGNILRRKALSLEYLEESFSSGKYALNTDALFKNGQEITFVLTNLKTGKPEYVKPNRDNIFQLMSISCSLPFVRKSIEFNGERYLDGGLTDPLPVKKALDDGCDRVIAVHNYPVNSSRHRKYHLVLEKAVGLLYFMYPETAKLISNHTENMQKAMKEIENDPRVIFIRPTQSLPLRSNRDTNQERIRLTVEAGIRETEKILEKLIQ